MTITRYRNHEPLYLIIVRADTAVQDLRRWCRDNNMPNPQIENNRLKLYDELSLHRFMHSWSGDWSNTLIWDCWNRRHIDRP